ncbi:hypothetical protein BSZ32_07830 [Rubritalea profundi]|uniref:VWFA domain-containing protein n=1 Tax=Rubritalea profundi TaxID=1658618 RepID=A0A2S7U099_9BACT|nr:hypothetical protein BSZ32_07830 [Rubritalea profundi]
MIAPAKRAAQPKVQIAILLDTSGSMDGLIEQAKSELWSIVNSFNSANKDGKAPRLEVALYEYGKQSLNAESNWQQCIVPFSNDLDLISETLFKLKTNGGDEYCGAVIERAVADMKWDEAAGTYKAIFIAGNEPFTQGPINVTQSCQSAKKKGIVVNTIHCGNQQVGVQRGWNIGPVVAGGSLLTIDHNAQVAHIDAPQDKVIIQLNIELNKTYVPYGKSGVKNKVRQEVQDNNALQKKSSGANVQRAICKSSHNYSNESWDLVDAAKKKQFDWGSVEKKDLPKPLQKLSDKALQAYVANNAKKRTEIQLKIQNTSQQRQRYIAKISQEKSENGAQTLDKVVIETVRKQAKELGYTFK